MRRLAIVPFLGALALVAAYAGSQTVSGVRFAAGVTTSDSVVIDRANADLRLQRTAGGQLELDDNAGGLAVLHAARTLREWLASEATLPASNPATLTARGDHQVLTFAAAQTKIVIYECIMPTSYSGGDLEIVIHWTAAGTSAGNYRIQWEFERLASGASTDLDVDGYATSTTSTVTAPTGDGVLVTHTIGGITNATADGILAGEALRWRFRRIGGDGADTNSDDMDMLRVEFKEGG